MITISIYLIFIGLIITAIGGLIYNYKSTESTNTSFKTAEEQRNELTNKMNQEFQTASKEMQMHKESLNAKVEKEAMTIITELKEKSLKANQALDNLKNQSENASMKISQEVNNLQETTEKHLTKLSYPLPNKLFIENLQIIIEPEVFEKFLPEIRKNLNTFPVSISPTKENNLPAGQLPPKEELIYSYQLQPNKYNKELQNIFEGKLFKINFIMGDDLSYLYDDFNKNIMSAHFETILSLENYNSTLHYKIDYTKGGKESFVLNLFNSGSDKNQSNSLKFINGVFSAKELCNKKVWIFINIDNNLNLRAPNVSVNHLSLKDNNSKDYKIEVLGFKSFDNNHRRDFLKTHYPNSSFPDSFFIETYISGLFKCESF